MRQTWASLADGLDLTNAPRVARKTMPDSHSAKCYWVILSFYQLLGHFVILLTAEKIKPFASFQWADGRAGFLAFRTMSRFWVLGHVLGHLSHCHGVFNRWPVTCRAIPYKNTIPNFQTWVLVQNDKMTQYTLKAAPRLISALGHPCKNAVTKP